MIVDTECTSASGKTESLQESFKRFLSEKKKEKKLQKFLKQNQKHEIEKFSLEEKRKIFVDRCKSYIGIPYHSRYHPDPNDEDHDAPLYLDCCALVRRVIKDMCENDELPASMQAFGRGNQAYQYDTLPIDLPSYQDMKPGDLVFIQGKYFKGDSHRRQRHDIVHIEVYVGPDEETVGARYQSGRIQIHDSFKFVSKNYSIDRIHFKSIDTWLNGKCDSICLEHTYFSSAVYSTAKSIFNEDSEDMSSDAVYDESSQEPRSSDMLYYVGKGNNSSLIVQVLEDENLFPEKESLKKKCIASWKRLPLEFGYRDDIDFKWVQLRSEIDFFRHKKGQLVNHIPNNNVITTKSGLFNTIIEHFGSIPDFLPETFNVDTLKDIELVCSRHIELELAVPKESLVWIFKPSSGNCGRGLKIISCLKELKEYLSKFIIEEKKSGIVQRYLTKPRLFDGRKFDFRAYCLISRTSPTYKVYFHTGYTKVSFENFSLENLDDNFTHLTNAFVQKGHPEYKNNKGSHIVSLTDLCANLGDIEISELENGMKSIMSKVFEASRDKLLAKEGFFDLLGFDFLLDEGNKIKLLEVNSNPSLYFDDSAILKKLLPTLVRDTVKLVIADQRPDILARYNGNALRESISENTGFEILFDGIESCQ